MYENEYMYAIERNGEYLAHYGVKGMKWGVRKAIERGNQRALGRQYRKAAKKLAKLEKRANSGKKYARRAAALGTGAAAAGGLAVAGTEGVAAGMRGLSALKTRLGGSKGLRNARRAASLGNRSGLNTAADAVSTWGKGSSGIAKGAATRYAQLQNRAALRAGNVSKKAAFDNIANKQNAVAGITRNHMVRAGAGLVGAGLAGAAGYNAYRAATTKRAAKKAAAFRSEMNKAFKGTQYANGAPRQGNRRRKRR